MPPRELCHNAVINTDFGGFGLSAKAEKMLGSKSNICTIPRNSAALVDIIEKLGAKANGDFARLTLVPLDAGKKYVLYEYDGMEWITEWHRVYNHISKRWAFPTGTGTGIRAIVKCPA